eukprot:1693361-Rhodomonas_salina.1
MQRQHRWSEHCQHEQREYQQTGGYASIDGGRPAKLQSRPQRYEQYADVELPPNVIRQIRATRQVLGIAYAHALSTCTYTLEVTSKRGHLKSEQRYPQAETRDTMLGTHGPDSVHSRVGFRELTSWVIQMEAPHCRTST